MRAAAVQLNSTDDKARNMEAADRLTRAAAADGADLVVLPEKVNLLGPDAALREGAETLEGATVTLGTRDRRASWASTWWPARSPSAATATTSSPTPRSTWAPTARCAASTARSTCST